MPRNPDSTTTGAFAVPTLQRPGRWRDRCAREPLGTLGMIYGAGLGIALDAGRYPPRGLWVGLGALAGAVLGVLIDRARRSRSGPPMG